MKKLITFLSICSTVAILALPVAARNFIAQPDTAIQDAACTDEAKEALYASFLKNRADDQAKAYEDAKKYLACPTTGITEAQTKIVDYLKKWVAKYEEVTRAARFTDLLYNQKKYPEAYALGKEILAAQPDNLKVMIDLGVNAYLLLQLNNAALSAEGLQHAKNALAALDAGKTVQDWKPLTGKEVAVAYLNYSIGTLSLQADPGNALKNLIKAAQFETPLKQSPYTYAYIAGAYETGPYAKMSEEYKAMYGGKDETPESKLMLANINQLIDRMIDGYARAVALANKPEFEKSKAVWNESLTTWYKYRNNGQTTGMDQLVAGILSKPLPPEPTPLTSLPPTATPAATPGNGVGTANGTGIGAANGQGVGAANGTGVGAANGTGVGNRAASTTTPASTTKPAGTKPDRPRN
ncbi:MAG TPA: hypothetical protein VGP83_02740 [Pyrinomonadaceae bacterium]|jgi:hypothetical protein|nr:hypothetical protein [Pyrinomonadaceae bacterium]